MTQFAPIEATDGRVYSVQACGEVRMDGRWDGWLAFFTADGTAYHTPRETVQPSFAALEHWAARLGLQYLDGALARTVETVGEVAVSQPADEEPGIERLVVEPVSGMYLSGLAEEAVCEAVVRGTVVAVDAMSGTLRLRSGRRVLEFHVPPSSVRDVAVGELITVQVSGPASADEDVA